VKSGKVSLPRCDLGQRQTHDSLGSVKAFSRVDQTVGRFGFHKSRPSLRRSHESGARLIGPGIKGLGGITAPVSSKMAVVSDASLSSSSVSVPGF
jgi:hypothetical protein